MSVRNREEIAEPMELVPSPDCVPQLPVLEGDVALVELLLLLTVHQAGALEAAAHRGGLTMAQMARHLIRDFLDREGSFLGQSVLREGEHAFAAFRQQAQRTQHRNPAACQGQVQGAPPT